MEINWPDYIGSGDWSSETAACLLLNINPKTIKKFKKLTANFFALRAQYRLNPTTGLSFDTALKENKDRLELLDKVLQIQTDLNNAAKKIIKQKNKNTSFDKNNYLLSPYKDLQDNEYYFFPPGVISWALSKGIDIPDKLRLFVKDLRPLSDDEWVDYNDNSSWIWTDAIYILHGFNPCPSASMETANTHFPLIASYFYKRAIKQNARTALATQSMLPDTPANWKAFWQSIINNVSKKRAKSKMGKTQPVEDTNWEDLAWEIGFEWMLSKDKEGKKVTVDRIAKYVTEEFKIRKITGRHGKILDWATIKRQALAGITKDLKDDSANMNS